MLLAVLLFLDLLMNALSNETKNDLPLGRASA